MTKENIIRDTKTLFNSIQDYVTARLSDLNTTFPAKVLKYYEDEQTADVLVMLKRVSDVDGSSNNEGQFIIPHAPVVFLGSADNASLTFPISEGTLGSITVIDKNIENWFFGNGDDIYEVADDRIHDFSDSVFIPGLRPKQRKYDGYDSSNVVLQNDQTKLSLLPTGKIKIENSSPDELIAILSDIIQELITAQVITAIGNQPFIPSTVSALTVLKAKLDTYKG